MASSNQQNNNNQLQEEESAHYIVQSDASPFSEHASIEVSIEAIHNQQNFSQGNLSDDTVVINEVPYYKAVPNKWRKKCKNHFEDFWKKYFHILFDDLDSKYHQRFIDLKIDDIRCIPFITEKHLLMQVQMITSHAQNALQMIYKFNQNKDIFFEWLSKTCQCPKYISNFEDAGILTWSIFAQRIVTKSDLNKIIPANQKNNNFDRNLLWRNIPKDVWDYYNIDRDNTISKRYDIASLSPSPFSTSQPTNLIPDISWNKSDKTPQKSIEILWIIFIIILFVFDVIVAVIIVFAYFTNSQMPNKWDNVMPYLINNILNPLHFMIQLLLIIGWMEWMVFVKQNKCVKWVYYCILVLLIGSVFIFILNIIVYFLEYHVEFTNVFMDYMHSIQTSKFYRNAWFIINGITFLIILFVIGCISICKIRNKKIKHLALRKEGENKIVKNLEKNKEIFCCRMFSYFSLTVVKYVLVTMFINLLMFTQTVIWIYWRYIRVSKLTHYEIRNNNEFKIIIFGLDMLCVLFGILLVYYLRKQRLNYEKIEEMHHSHRKFNHSAMQSEDINGISSFHTTPIL
eukprot:312163_1